MLRLRKRIIACILRLRKRAGEASVDDKSFLSLKITVSEEEPPVEMPPATQSKGFVKSVINFLADELGERAGFLEQLL